MAKPGRCSRRLAVCGIASCWRDKLIDYPPIHRLSRTSTRVGHEPITPSACLPSMLDALGKPKTRRREHSSRSLDQSAARERSKTEKSLEVAPVKSWVKQLVKRALFPAESKHPTRAARVEMAGGRRWLADAIVQSWPCRRRRHPLLLSSLGYRVHPPVRDLPHSDPSNPFFIEDPSHLPFPQPQPLHPSKLAPPIT